MKPLIFKFKGKCISTGALHGSHGFRLLFSKEAEAFCDKLNSL